MDVLDDFVGCLAYFCLVLLHSYGFYLVIFLEPTSKPVLASPSLLLYGQEIKGNAAIWETALFRGEGDTLCLKVLRLGVCPTASSAPSSASS